MVTPWECAQFTLVGDGKGKFAHAQYTLTEDYFSPTDIGPTSSTRLIPFSGRAGRRTDVFGQQPNVKFLSPSLSSSWRAQRRWDWVTSWHSCFTVGKITQLLNRKLCRTQSCPVRLWGRQELLVCPGNRTPIFQSSFM